MNENKSYVFRIQDKNQIVGLKESISHWGESNQYNDKQINAILSSNPHSFKQPTSIPSPFARFFLAKTAFEEVADKKDKALMSYQKIVSDCLDVAELFIFYPKWENIIKIIEWSPKEQLEILKAKSPKLHKTFDLFFKNDKELLNFNPEHSIYIIQKKSGEVLGSTSPATVFLSPPYSEKSRFKDLKLGNNRILFDEKICHINERSQDFIKILYVLKSNKERLKLPHNPLWEYLDRYSKDLDESLREEINNLTWDEFINNVKPHNDAKVHGETIYYYEQISPENWTEKDVFEDYLLRIDSISRNTKNFELGTEKRNRNSLYLLPIKDKILCDLKKLDIKYGIEFDGGEYTCEVTFSYTYNKKDYHLKKTYRSDVIKSFHYLNLAIFPLVKFSNKERAKYRIGLLTEFNDSSNFQLTFHTWNQTSIESKSVCRNHTSEDNPKLTTYIIENNNFDYIKLHYKDYKGIIIPKFKNITPNKSFNFAIDLGTSNTHIEYSIGNEKNTRSFDINSGEEQVSILHSYEFTEHLSYFEESYIPLTTGEDNFFTFPMITALSCGENVSWESAYFFGEASFEEHFGKKENKPYSRSITNLKWSDEDENTHQLKIYIQSLLYLIRNKVLLNNGDLDKTQITWFYPTSMERRRYELYENLWKTCFEKLISDDLKKLKVLPESIAPFEYYIKDGDTTDLITIDIGGGTTDVVFAHNLKVDYITSFRFASNVIYGDAFSENQSRNGLIESFYDYLDNKSEHKDLLKPILGDLSELKEKKSSQDLALIFYELSKNKKVKEANLESALSFSEFIKKQHEFRILFILFYAAIIYHIAQIMKSKQLKPPHKIVFTGNGSLNIDYISTDEKIIADFTQKIFTIVYEDDKIFKQNISIVINKKNPKEATCKGGLLCEESSDYDFGKIFGKIITLHSDGSNRVFSRTDNTPENKNSAINEEYRQKTVQENKKFLDIFFDKIIPFFAQKGYNIETDCNVQDIKEICFSKLDNYAQVGFQRKLKEIQKEKDSILSETLFFYPLIGLMKEISISIYESKKDKSL